MQDYCISYFLNGGSKRYNLPAESVEDADRKFGIMTHTAEANGADINIISVDLIDDLI